MNDRSRQGCTRIFIIVVFAAALGCFGLFGRNVRAQPDHKAPTTTSTQPSDVSECKRCHECEKPTLKHPCLPNCMRFQAAAEEFAQKLGPEIVILDKLKGVYLPVPFDHKGHAKMAQMTKGCATCHHYTPEGQEHPACDACHSITDAGTDIHKPGLKGAYHRQCLGCHKDWIDETDCAVCHRKKRSLPANGEALPSPTSDDILGRMHPPISQPTTEIYRAKTKGGEKSAVIFRHWEHVQGFDLKCVDCHHEDTCVRCHKKGNGEKAPPTVKEHHKPCLRCHKVDMDESTTEITGRCKRCHWQEGQPPIKPFDHADTGWPLSKYHVGNRCRTCHKRVPFVKLNKDCNACHSAWEPETFNHAITGQMLDETHAEVDCAECHADRKFDKPPVCTECHDEEEGFVFPQKRPGPATTSAPARPNVKKAAVSDPRIGP